MPAAKQTIEHVETLERYKHGFVTDIAQEFAPRGLNEQVIRFISAQKGEHTATSRATLASSRTGPPQTSHGTLWHGAPFPVRWATNWRTDIWTRHFAQRMALTSFTAMVSKRRCRAGKRLPGGSRSRGAQRG